MRYAKNLRYAIAFTAAAALGAAGCSDNNNSNPDSGVAGRSGSGGAGGLNGTGGAGHGGSGGVYGAGGHAGTTGSGGSGHAGSGGGLGSGGTFGTGGNGGHGGQAGEAGAGGRAATGGAGGGAGATAMLSDGQIIAVLLEANAGEVHTADIADVRATEGEVQAFSMQIRSDHAAAEMRQTALVQSDGFTVSDSPQRQMVAEMANAAISTLWMTPMAEFNRGFVQEQIALHMSVLDLINNVLLPQVTSTALRTEVQAERTAVEMHLTLAQTLLAALDNGGAGGAGGNGGRGGAGGN